MRERYMRVMAEQAAVRAKEKALTYEEVAKGALKSAQDARRWEEWWRGIAKLWAEAEAAKEAVK